MLRKALLYLTMLCFAFTGLSGPAQATETSMLTSYYGPGLYGNLTASGAPFYYGSHYAASPYLPFGTQMTVCYIGCTEVVVMDRGPYTGGRELDLEQSAAEDIGLVWTGVGVDYVSVYY